MAINVKNPEAERMVRELVAVTGESLTDAILAAVRERLERERRRRGFDRDRSWQRIRAIQARIRERPLLDDRTPDEIVGYDAFGAPG
jgi:antitoxin VapB